MTTRFVPTTTRSATEVVESDREWTTDERDAFATFTDRIADLDVVAVNPTTDEFQQPSTQLLAQSPHNSNAATTLEEVHDIYRETVMAVDHYADVYDDTLEESLAQEFGLEVATTVRASDQLTPQLRDQLVECSQQARESRHSLLQGLKSEHSALETADEKLTRLGSDLDGTVGTRSFENWTARELADADERLRSRRHECEQLLTDRQATLSEQRVPSTHRIDHEFNEYLYGSLSVTYPVVSDTTSLIGTLRTAHQSVDRALTGRGLSSDEESATAPRGKCD
ncbi:DUF7260 family protein [Halococcus thailandensis]|uniref:DUF7260 domain-containing protein n=1 Tax=Halococcus thailandensis JCM 13552 TaxID=1227457 RepID=M0NER2_9EURY|nr:hypothetical protein [Halococcus thailandensis]EMA56346.1 hypothetical protein C451_02924 [Halococcus thailandensis JCM 13552]